MIQSENGRLRVTGAMTVDTATKLEAEGAALIASGGERFDLSQVGKVDSAAVGVVLAWIRAAQAAGKQVRLEGLPTSFSSLARLYGVDEILQPFLATE